MSWALSMMLHQLLHWPDAFGEALWPFALEHAVCLWNHLPKSRSGLSPHELFTGSASPNRDEILRARVWGSPAWALDPAIQDGRCLPRWSKCSVLGMCLGVSPTHSTTVERVLIACLTTFRTTAWEDNAGAWTSANLDPGQTAPRSGFHDSKVHWFRSHLERFLCVAPIG